MDKKSGGYNTNIASEFYVISCLARLGKNVNMTLGNQKKVDIVLVNSDKTYLTIDVKAVADKMDWIIGNKEPERADNHFYLLMSYEGKINDLSAVPRCWIIPSKELKGDLLMLAGNERTRYVRRKYVLENCKHYLESWESLR